MNKHKAAAADQASSAIYSLEVEFLGTRPSSELFSEMSKEIGKKNALKLLSRLARAADVRPGYYGIPIETMSKEKQKTHKGFDPLSEKHPSKDPTGFFAAPARVSRISGARPNPSASIQRAERIRAAFQGEAPDSAREVRKPAPLVLVMLGRAVAIEYESDKLNGGGDGTKATYRHEFAPGDVLATDQDGRTLYVIGPRLRVNSRGIVD